MGFCKVEPRSAILSLLVWPELPLVSYLEYPFEYEFDVPFEYEPFEYDLEPLTVRHLICEEGKVHLLVS